MRPTRVEIDADAIAHNVAFVAKVVAPSTVCAVVKADGYGHGAVAASQAALRGGASWLAVALVEEAARLREAGIDAPILVLSECRPDAMRRARDLDVRMTLYSATGVSAAAAITGPRGAAPWPVHLKVDTGMHRVGASPDEIVARARAIADAPGLLLEALWTHCAVADDLGDPFTAAQLDRFEAAVEALDAEGHLPVMLHAANSAVALLHPRGRYDMVRLGISMYGCPPASHHLDLARELRPALRLVSRVSHVQRVSQGEGVSYGHRWRAERETTVATVPIGYADGVRRDLGLEGGSVLIGGSRRRIIGVVTMDQLMVDCATAPVAVDDEVVLIGTQGDDAITADEIADRLGTISYEVLCDIGVRVPRHQAGGPERPSERGGDAS
ncbi:MAG TPA: alanine racemase [Acidimicrobiales bacterium]|nr:alanine racemase [Acidimicrobiales bacterium]